jgi:hypothetical protein
MLMERQMRYKALLLMIFLLLTIEPLARTQERDSLIMGSITIDTSRSVVWIPVYGVTFDSLEYYNVQVQVYAPEDGILMGNIINYYPPISSWIHDDMITINQNRIWQIGWTGTALPLFTAGARVHLWSITFMIAHGTPPQTVLIDTVGSFSFGNNPVFVPGYVYYIPTGINEPVRPEKTVLSQNYPNPFNPSTEIAFTLEQDGHVSLIIYDLLGREIRTLLDKTMTQGSYTVTWDGRGAFGADLPSGIYFYRLTSGNFNETKLMTLIR